MSAILRAQQQWFMQISSAQGPVANAAPGSGLFFKKMAFIYNVLKYIQKSEDINPDQVNDTFQLYPPPETTVSPTKARRTEFLFSPSSQALYDKHSPKITVSLQEEWLTPDNLLQFIEFAKKATGKERVLAPPTFRDLTLYEPAQIGDALHTWAGSTRDVDGAEHQWAAARQGYVEGNVTFTPHDADGLLVAPYVNINGNTYSFYITDEFESPYKQKPRVYPALYLHGSENGRFHITMHAIDTNTMYLDNLYHSSELGDNVGKRLSAVDVFQFIKDMGYKTIKLSDASSIPLLMPVECGPYAMYFPFEYGETGSAYEYVDITSHENGNEAYVQHLDMSSFNVVKHMTLANRHTIRVYAEAAQKVRTAIDGLQNEVAAHAGKLADAERVVQQSAIKRSRTWASVLTIKFTRTEPGAPRKLPQAEYLLLLRKLRDARHRKLVF